MLQFGKPTTYGSPHPSGPLSGEATCCKHRQLVAVSPLGLCRFLRGKPIVSKAKGLFLKKEQFASSNFTEVIVLYSTLTDTDSILAPRTRFHFDSEIRLDSPRRHAAAASRGGEPRAMHPDPRDPTRQAFRRHAWGHGHPRARRPGTRGGASGAGTKLAPSLKKPC